jgi:hypothetical protein
MNKKSFFKVTAGVLLGIMLLVSGCGKDDNNPKNNFTYDDKTYDLSQGLILSDTLVTGQVYSHYILLFSDGFTIHLKEGSSVVDSITGRGEAIIFALFSAKPTPEDGKYTHLPSDKSLTVVPDVFTWAGGRLFIDYSETDEDEDYLGNRYDMVSGTIEVKAEGSGKYEFKINTLSEEEKPITGYANLKLTPIRFGSNDEKSLNLNSILGK